MPGWFSGWAMKNSAKFLLCDWKLNFLSSDASKSTVGNVFFVHCILICVQCTTTILHSVGISS